MLFYFSVLLVFGLSVIAQDFMLTLLLCSLSQYLTNVHQMCVNKGLGFSSS